MSLVFWAAVVVVAYACVGYLGWLWLQAKLSPRPAMRGSAEPGLSVVMVARNEERVLEAKLQNLLTMDYPPEKLQIVVVSDGSTDATEAILRQHSCDPRIRVVLNQLPAGKALGLNDGMNFADGEIVVLTDARQYLEPAAFRFLVENFAAPEVGAVSGELMLGDPLTGETGRGMGLYWQLEKRVRELESATGSVVGATGAIYAVRRELVPQLPPDTILDDVFIPMQIARQGYRVLFDSRARAWDDPDLGSEREFRRKVRTLMGNYQLLQLLPWLLKPENPLLFKFLSHKVIRLVVPLALVVALASAWFATGTFYRVAFWTQLSVCALSLLGWTGWKLGPLNRLTDAAYTFAALNVAAVVAFVNFITGQKAVWIQPSLPKEVQLR